MTKKHSLITACSRNINLLHKFYYNSMHSLLSFLQISEIYVHIGIFIIAYKFLV